MSKTYQFKQGNGEIVPVTIDANSKKKFGSFGFEEGWLMRWPKPNVPNLGW